MIIHAQTGQYRSRTLRPGLRRRVAARRTEEMSPELRRAVGITLCTALFFLLAGGWFFHWITVGESLRTEQLQAVTASLDTANINLRAKKAGLLSPNILKLWRPCVSASMLRFQARFIVSDNAGHVYRKSKAKKAQKGPADGHRAFYSFVGGGWWSSVSITPLPPGYQQDYPACRRQNSAISTEETGRQAGLARHYLRP